jgi:putative endonuclease
MLSSSFQSRRGRLAFASGLAAEYAAMLALTLKGYRILAHRTRTPFGEIDIAARTGDTLVIIEVKKRSGAGEAAGAITRAQQQRLMKAAEFFAGSLTNPPQTIRLDAILFSGPFFWPRHIRHAFF